MGERGYASDLGPRQLLDPAMVRWPRHAAIAAAKNYIRARGRPPLESRIGRGSREGLSSRVAMWALKISCGQWGASARLVLDL
eukprot:7795971-Pyramimonas_sp.AAC.1